MVAVLVPMEIGLQGSTEEERTERGGRMAGAMVRMVATGGVTAAIGLETTTGLMIENEGPLSPGIVRVQTEVETWK
jgi:hypothetical protein